MPLHLSYDGRQKNGIIFNDLYPWGAMFEGEQLKPDLGFPYDAFSVSQVFTVDPPTVWETGAPQPRLATPEEISTILAFAAAWVQPLGQEGNETDEQKQKAREEYADAALGLTDRAILDAYELGEAIPAETAQYRQNVRALKESPNHPRDIQWPSLPQNPVKSAFRPLKRWQFQAMLDILELRNQVDQSINAISNKTERSVAKAKLNNSDIFLRDDPLVVTLSAAVGLLPEELDTAWIQASQL